MEVLLNIRVEQLPEGVYLATSEDLPGLVAQGRTVAETLEIARDMARKLLTRAGGGRSRSNSPRQKGATEMARKFRELEERLPVGVRERVQRRVQQTIAELPLCRLRSARELTLAVAQSRARCLLSVAPRLRFYPIRSLQKPALQEAPTDQATTDGQKRLMLVGPAFVTNP